MDSENVKFIVPERTVMIYRLKMHNFKILTLNKINIHSRNQRLYLISNDIQFIIDIIGVSWSQETV